MVDGHWEVDFTVSAQNRPQGWSVRPQLMVVGQDGRGAEIEWAEPPIPISDAQIEGGRVQLPHQKRKRILKAQFRGVSGDLPIPIAEAVLELVAKDAGPVES